ncbi:unnamed protein product [Protopolystoma xenopodis]|uniref:Uncharacterized protein n=1 Tax=Protopolystoma xenopodis TaxID=117903 RepID=A0A3S5CFG2_9PLAT|nr:unnamed protein product [Protopolystoma xenopodis]
MQEYGEIVCVMGSCLSMGNMRLLSRGDTCIALRPVLSRVCGLQKETGSSSATISCMSATSSSCSSFSSSTSSSNSSSSNLAPLNQSVSSDSLRWAGRKSASSLRSSIVYNSQARKLILAEPCLSANEGDNNSKLLFQNRNIDSHRIPGAASSVSFISDQLAENEELLMRLEEESAEVAERIFLSASRRSTAKTVVGGPNEASIRMRFADGSHRHARHQWCRWRLSLDTGRKRLSSHKE